MSKSDTYKKLAHYSKEAIIEGLLRAPFAFEDVPGRLLENLEQEEWRRLKSEGKKAHTAVDKAITAYLEWTKAMSEKYGDGEKFAFHLLSKEEQEAGISLLKAWEEAKKHRISISKKIDKHLKMTGATA